MLTPVHLLPKYQVLLPKNKDVLIWASDFEGYAGREYVTI